MYNCSLFIIHYPLFIVHCYPIKRINDVIAYPYCVV